MPRPTKGYTESAVAAAESGINVFDTAINYRFQRSERNIAEALKQLAAKGFSRDELVLCTKGGYLTPEGAMPGDPNEYFFKEYIQPGIFSAKDLVGGGHCMTPKFLKNQLGRSLRNLRRLVRRHLLPAQSGIAALGNIETGFFGACP